MTDPIHIGITIFVLGLAAWGIKPLADKFKLPYTSLLVVVGFVISEILVALNIDTGLRWDSFHQLVYYVLLPVLIYEAAFRLKADSFFNNMLPVLILSIPFMLVAVLITAVLIYLGIDHAAGFPFVAALITAALVSANDPSAVFRIIKGLNVSQRLVSLLKGESLFNSLLVLVLVSLAISVEMQSHDGDTEFSFLQGFILFVKLFSGGILTGFACGLAGWLLLHFSRLPILRGMITIIIVYGTFLLAETVVNVSGIVAVLVAGLLLNAYAQRTEEASQKLLNKQWEYSAFFATVVLFLLLGMSVYLPILQSQWLAIVIGIAAVLIARAVIIFGGFWLYGNTIKTYRLSSQETVPLFWGGIKGAVTVALVFILPEGLAYVDTIQGIVYGVVLFSLLVQAPTLRFIARSKND